MFEYDEGLDPVRQAKKVGRALASARHEADRRGIKPFLFHATSSDEFDARLEMHDVDSTLEEIANKYLTEVSDGKQKLAKSLKKEFEKKAEKEASLKVHSKDYSDEKRKQFAEKGWALADGSYPIADCGDLKDAIHRVGTGNASEATIKAHILKRWKALKCPGPKPFTSDDSDGSEKEASVKEAAEKDSPRRLIKFEDFRGLPSGTCQFAGCMTAVGPDTHGGKGGIAQPARGSGKSYHYCPDHWEMAQLGFRPGQGEQYGQYLESKESSVKEAKKAVCPSCEGEGAVDSFEGGFTAQDVDEWYGPDSDEFYEDYGRGAYDKKCSDCNGQGVVPGCREDGCKEPAAGYPGAHNACYDHMDDDEKEDVDSYHDSLAEEAAERRMGA